MRGIERSTIFYAVMFVIVLLIVLGIMMTVQGGSINRELEIRKYCEPWLQAGWGYDQETLEKIPNLEDACRDYIGKDAGPLRDEDWTKCKGACLVGAK